MESLINDAEFSSHLLTKIIQAGRTKSLITSPNSFQRTWWCRRARWRRPSNRREIRMKTRPRREGHSSDGQTCGHVCFLHPPEKRNDFFKKNNWRITIPCCSRSTRCYKNVDKEGIFIFKRLGESNMRGLHYRNTTTAIIKETLSHSFGQDGSSYPNWLGIRYVVQKKTLFKIYSVSYLSCRWFLEVTFQLEKRKTMSRYNAVLYLWVSKMGCK